MRFLAICLIFLLTQGNLLAMTSLRFAIIADWGGIPIFPYKTFVELAVGRELDTFARKFGLDAIFALGDNFYFDGVKNVNDSRFKNTFEDAFDYESLHVPWLVIAGNHDHYGNVSAQIAYSAVSDRWHFPDYYYKKHFSVPNSNSSVDVVMIDTVLLCGNTVKEYPYEQPSLKFSNKYIRDKHWTWLEETLKSSKANYLLLCGHFPVYSIATNGPTDCLIEYLIPLLKKYNVSAYLSGHDHNIQHIQVKGEGDPVIDLVVTGGTNIIDPSTENKDKIPSGSLKFHWGDPFSLGAFTYITVDSSKITFGFYLSSGKLLYNFSKSPRL